MSDYDDYDEDDFYDLDWFYIDEPDDEVGDLAEHAVASPPPIDYVDNDDDWDRYDYWNELAYGSDAYNDSDSGVKRKASSPRGSRKRRKQTQNPRASHGGDGEHTTRQQSTSVAVDGAPLVIWRDASKSDQRKPPLLKGPSFALLKDWRSRFDSPSQELESPDDVHVTEPSHHMEIDPDALKMALQENLSKLLGEQATGDVNQAMLHEYASKMLSAGASADELAGELADTLFKRTASGESDCDTGADEGEFEQWVLSCAQEKAEKIDERSSAISLDDPNGFGAALAVAATESAHGVGMQARLSSNQPDTTAIVQLPTPTPTQVSPSSDTRRASATSVVTVSSTQITSSSGSLKTMQTSSSIGKRRRATDDGDDVERSVRPKRATTRSFDALTASSKARSAAAGSTVAGKVNTAKARSTSRNVSVDK